MPAQEREIDQIVVDTSEMSVDEVLSLVPPKRKIGQISGESSRRLVLPAESITVTSGSSGIMKAILT